jgi:hypothetical protein
MYSFGYDPATGATVIPRPIDPGKVVGEVDPHNYTIIFTRGGRDEVAAIRTTSEAADRAMRRWRGILSSQPHVAESVRVLEPTDS